MSSSLSSLSVDNKLDEWSDDGLTRTKSANDSSVSGLELDGDVSVFKQLDAIFVCDDSSYWNEKKYDEKTNTNEINHNNQNSHFFPSCKFYVHIHLLQEVVTMNSYDQYGGMQINSDDDAVAVDLCGCGFDCCHHCLVHLWLVRFHCYSIALNAQNNP